MHNHHKSLIESALHDRGWSYCTKRLSKAAVCVWPSTICVCDCNIRIYDGVSNSGKQTIIINSFYSYEETVSCCVLEKRHRGFVACGSLLVRHFGSLVAGFCVLPSLAQPACQLLIHTKSEPSYKNALTKSDNSAP